MVVYRLSGIGFTRWHYSIAVGSGFYFGYCIMTIFSFRFFVEFLKKEQVDFEQGMFLDMGQLLSIPLVLVGLWCMIKK
jgi:prolipoprotein diacylglyceryltransferase